MLATQYSTPLPKIATPERPRYFRKYRPTLTVTPCRRLTCSVNAEIARIDQLTGERVVEKPRPACPDGGDYTRVRLATYRRDDHPFAAMGVIDQVKAHGRHGINPDRARHYHLTPVGRGPAYQRPPTELRPAPPERPIDREFDTTMGHFEALVEHALLAEATGDADAMRLVVATARNTGDFKRPLWSGDLEKRREFWHDACDADGHRLGDKDRSGKRIPPPGYAGPTEDRAPRQELRDDYHAEKQRRRDAITKMGTAQTPAAIHRAQWEAYKAEARMWELAVELYGPRAVCTGWHPPKALPGPLLASPVWAGISGSFELVMRRGQYLADAMERDEEPIAETMAALKELEYVLRHAQARPSLVEAAADVLRARATGDPYKIRTRVRHYHVLRGCYAVLDKAKA